MSVDDHTVALARATTFYRSAPSRTPATPVFIHGVPTSSDIWVPVLERTGGVALDLPGFGRSDKGGHLDYTLHGLAAAVTELIEALELSPVSLVGHGWGAAVALAALAARPAARLLLIEPEPTGEWSRLERAWRTRAVGELAMGALTRRTLARALRARATTDQAWPPDRVDALWEQFDQGTQRAVLRLYRGAGPDALATLAAAAPDTETLTLLGDGGIPPSLAANVQRIPGAGHWPWLDVPECIATIAAFLGAP